MHAVKQLAKTNLRQEFGNLTLDESLVAREHISEKIRNTLGTMTEDWGSKGSQGGDYNR
jgi:regulator of protease activity HflC (stomatin/prohibitin superfamily)